MAKSNSYYDELCRTFAGLLEPESVTTGLANEYVRGGVELIVELTALSMDDRKAVLGDVMRHVNEQQEGSP